MRTLENRLQQASVRLSEAAGRTRTLRARVDGLRRERLLFEELRRKLGAALARRATEMVALVAAISEAHDAREKVGSERCVCAGGGHEPRLPRHACWCAIRRRCCFKGKSSYRQSATLLATRQSGASSRTSLSRRGVAGRLLGFCLAGQAAPARIQSTPPPASLKQDRAAREAQRKREIARREAEMAALFRQGAPSGGRRRPSGSARAQPSGSSGPAGREGADTPSERVREHKEAFERIKAATGARDARKRAIERGAPPKRMPPRLALPFVLPPPQAHRGWSSCWHSWQLPRRPTSPSLAM